MSHFIAASVVTHCPEPPPVIVQVDVFDPAETAVPYWMINAFAPDEGFSCVIACGVEPTVAFPLMSQTDQMNSFAIEAVMIPLVARLVVPVVAAATESATGAEPEP